jgi:hypothetical protein
MKATLVLSLPLTEASAKVRTGPPIDDEEDYAIPVWAGVLPLCLSTGEAINDERLQPEISLPDYVRNYSRPVKRNGRSSAQLAEDLADVIGNASGM